MAAEAGVAVAGGVGTTGAGGGGAGDTVEAGVRVGNDGCATGDEVALSTLEKQATMIEDRAGIDTRPAALASNVRRLMDALEGGCIAADPFS